MSALLTTMTPSQNHAILTCLHNEELHSLRAVGTEYHLLNEDSPDKSPIVLTHAQAKDLVEAEGVFSLSYVVTKADFLKLGFSKKEAAQRIEELDYLADELSGGKPEKNRRLRYMERPQQLDQPKFPSVPMTTDIELA